MMVRLILMDYSELLLPVSEHPLATVYESLIKVEDESVLCGGLVHLHQKVNIKLGVLNSAQFLTFRGGLDNIDYPSKRV